MSYEQEVRKTFDQQWATRYRQSDGQLTPSRQHYCELLRELSSGSGRKIDVLDVGCGTGRYFHCLRNVRRLVGIDLSEHMLTQAREAASVQSLDVEHLELLCGEVHSVPLQERSFELIVSVGVFGEYSPVDGRLLDRLYELLAPGGKLFLTAVDTYSRFQESENAPQTLSLRILRRSFRALPATGKLLLNQALGSHFVTESQLVALFDGSRFEHYGISRYQHVSGWSGVHLDCVAEKGTHPPR